MLKLKTGLLGLFTPDSSDLKHTYLLMASKVQNNFLCSWVSSVKSA